MRLANTYLVWVARLHTVLSQLQPHHLFSCRLQSILLAYLHISTCPPKTWSVLLSQNPGDEDRSHLQRSNSHLSVTRSTTKTVFGLHQENSVSEPSPRSVVSRLLPVSFLGYQLLPPEVVRFDHGSMTIQFDLLLSRMDESDVSAHGGENGRRTEGFLARIRLWTRTTSPQPQGSVNVDGAPVTSRIADLSSIAARYVCSFHCTMP